MNKNIRKDAGNAKSQPVPGEFINLDVFLLCMIVPPDGNPAAQHCAAGRSNNLLLSGVAAILFDIFGDFVSSSVKCCFNFCTVGNVA